MVNKLPDQELIKMTLQGDKQAFDVLIIKYYPKITNLVGHYLRGSAEVGDATQETFIKAYEALANFRGESSFATWLYRIAINTSKNYLIAGNKRIMEDIESIILSGKVENAAMRENASPEAELQCSEMSCKLLNAIEGLPEELRTAIILRELEGLSYQQIAQEMSCPIGTVRSRIFRAREAIDKSMKGYIG